MQALLSELLGPLHMHLAAARTLYGQYLEGGKRFAFADALRQTNLRARSLLLEKGWMLPEPLQADAAALIAHWEVWLSLWEAHRRATDPEPNDEFAFANDFTWPAESARRLEDLYEALRPV